MGRYRGFGFGLRDFRRFRGGWGFEHAEFLDPDVVYDTA